MSSELAQIQRALQQHLLHGDAAINDLIAATAAVRKSVRLNIYANAYRVRIVEALSADFGVLHAYLGDAEFAAMVNAYIDRHPSRYFSLRNVGSDLVEFLRHTEPYAAHIDLHELAQFEWALCHAFDAPDDNIAAAADFAALKPEQWPELTLNIVRAATVIALHGNAPAIWKALNNGQQPPAAAQDIAAQSWLIWRSDLKLLFRPLDIIEATALNAFRAGMNFADVCGELAGHLPEVEVPQRAVELLQQWLQDRLIAAP